MLSIKCRQHRSHISTSSDREGKDDAYKPENNATSIIDKQDVRIEYVLNI